VADKVKKLAESDWEILFQATDYKIGSTVLELTPLSLASLARITRRLTAIVDKVSALELNLESLGSDASKIILLVELLLTDCPEILSELSGLDVNDVQRLPLDIAVELFNVCVDVNLQSQDNLVKNFKGLGGKVAKFMSGTNTVQ
jgi:hypothetical protein